MVIASLGGGQMRLWHQDFINRLPRQQLLGQHRECCALRGKGWGRPHATVQYVFEHSPYKLYQYHWLVMEEMENRGYHVDQKWKDPYYRGKSCPPYNQLETSKFTQPIYPEHDENYKQECLENLAQKVWT